MNMTTKRMTLRIPDDLLNQLHELADERATSLNTLATQALSTFVVQQHEAEDHLPLEALSDLLAPAVQADGIEEESLLHFARDVRRKLWKDFYVKQVAQTNGA